MAPLTPPVRVWFAGGQGRVLRRAAFPHCARRRGRYDAGMRRTRRASGAGLAARWTRTVPTLLLFALGCVGNPGYRTSADLPPLRVDLGDFVRDRLAALGYDVTGVVPRPSSVTFSAVKITPGEGSGHLILDWLYVTVTPKRLLTDPAAPEESWGSYVDVRAESFDEGRESRAIPTTPRAVSDAEAFVAALKAQPVRMGEGAGGS